MSVRRLVTIGSIASAAVVLWATPAAAHVEVTADKPRAGATDVTLSFSAESESDSAGIVSLRVVLPAGITPTAVTWVSGPAGWRLTPARDGYTVGGRAVRPGVDATYRVKVAQLPADATSLAFKTLQTYSDGHVDRGIEIPDGNVEPDNPAPVLKLAPAAAPPATSPPATATPAASPTPTATAVPTFSDAAAPAADGAGGPWLWIGVGVAAVLALLVGVLAWARRRASSGNPAGGA